MTTPCIDPSSFFLGAMFASFLLGFALFLAERAHIAQARRARLMRAAKLLCGRDVRAMKRYCSDAAIRAAMARAGGEDETIWSYGKNR